MLLVVVTADRGLCGAFNANVIRAAQNSIREQQLGDRAAPADRPQGERLLQAPPDPDPPQATHVFQALSLETGAGDRQTT